MTPVLSMKQQPWPVPCPRHLRAPRGPAANSSSQSSLGLSQASTVLQLDFSLSLGGEGDTIWPSFLQCSLESEERFRHPGLAAGMLASQAKFLPVLAPGKGCN